MPCRRDNIRHMVSYVEKRELSMQKSVQVIVPMKSVKADKGKDLTVATGQTLFT